MIYKNNYISHIYKNIYISNYKIAEELKKLSKYNIGAVLYIGNKQKKSTIIDQYTNNNINYKFLCMDDTIESDISECFEPSWSFINENIKQKRNILVHCCKGISRSPAIVAYYLMRMLYEYRISKTTKKQPILNEILDLIHLYRPCSNPNINFILQLKIWEKNNM